MTNPVRNLIGRSAVIAATLLIIHSLAAASDPPTGPGGIIATAQIKSITNNASTPPTVTIEWLGYAGPYTVQKNPFNGASAWEDVATNLQVHAVTIPSEEDKAFYRIKGHAPNYAGSDKCYLCHEEWDEWSETKHAKAFATLQQINMAANPACVGCHTVAFNTPTGFSLDTNSANYAPFINVQCENCHGPSGNHAATTWLGETPVRSLSANVCGGCHTGPHHPNFEEWSTSGHATVTPDVASSLLTGGEARMNSCGACHSGAVRMAMLNGIEEGGVTLPSAADAASVGITCVVCHDPHAVGDNVAQLRNPTYSTNFFSYSTATTTSFAKQYDPGINICGQCHNMRGATWKDTSRPPHHSPQYNILIGKGGYEVGTPVESPHGTLITNQCAHCHMSQVPAPAATVENPSINGHTFKPIVTTTSCTPCHQRTPETMEGVIVRTQTEITNRIASVKALLDNWATNKAPEAIRTNYGALAWEYSTPGVLSNPEGNSKITGPATTNQVLIPDAIKQARFNLYLIQHDASFGVHNADYTRFLLQVAEDNVKGLMQ
jgi:hypothetical protein